MSYQDNMTLDEIHDYDNEMVDVAIKGAKKYTFKALVPCLKFMGTAMDATMKYLGITITKRKHKSETDKQLHAKAVERMLDKKEVRIERRRHYKGKEGWRNGLYIYKKDVLVAYISTPMASEPNKFAIHQDESYSIVTNAKVEKYA